MLLPENIWNDENLIKALKGQGVAVMPTDTIYGIVGSALSIPVVNRIYTLRKRNPEKPCIILISNARELEDFSIVLSREQEERIKEYWPIGDTEGTFTPTSIILDCSDEAYAYLHRGTKTLAFRMACKDSLRALLSEVGPLIAPSANPEGLTPAEDILEAKKYFGDSVDIYVDGGKIVGKPSRVISIHKDGSVSVIRK